MRRNPHGIKSLIVTILHVGRGGCSVRNGLREPADAHGAGSAGPCRRYGFPAYPPLATRHLANSINDDFRHLHQAPRLHLGPGGDPGGAGPGVVRRARRRPVPGRRLPGLHRHHRACRGERRGDGDLGHQADRGHHQHGLAASTSCVRRRRRASRSSPCSSCCRRTATSGTQEVRDKVNTILRDLPDGTEPPIVDKFDTGSMPGDDDRRLGPARLPRGDRAGAEADQGAARDGQRRRRDHAGRRPGPGDEHRGRHRASSPPTTSRSTTSGTALVRQNLEVPGGRIDQGPRELVLRTLGRLSTAAEFNALIVANRNGYPIRIQRHRPGRGFVRGAAHPRPARRRQRRQPGRPEAVGA